MSEVDIREGFHLLDNISVGRALLVTLDVAESQIVVDGILRFDLWIVVTAFWLLADNHIDGDICIFHSILSTSLDGFDEVDVPGCATVHYHEAVLWPDLRREHSWDRGARYNCLWEAIYGLIEVHVSAGVDVDCSHSPLLLVRFTMLFEKVGHILDER